MGYTRFDHTERSGVYSGFRWGSRHFDSVDTAHLIRQNGQTFPNETNEEGKSRYIYRHLLTKMAMTLTKKILAAGWTADDHAIFRTGVTSALHTLSKESFTVVGEAANGKEALQLVQIHEPDVVLMDAEMPLVNGIDATALLKQTHRTVRTIALSYSNASSTVLGMLNAGAERYLLKGAGLEELAFAIRSVHSGIPYFSQATAVHMATKIKRDANGKSESEKLSLTKRETEILSHICSGESSKEIAAALCVSKRTVDTFRNKMMKKAGVKNVVHLLVYAIKEHIIQDLFMLVLLLNELGIQEQIS